MVIIARAALAMAVVQAVAEDKAVPVDEVDLAAAHAIAAIGRRAKDLKAIVPDLAVVVVEKDLEAIDQQAKLRKSDLLVRALRKRRAPTHRNRRAKTKRLRSFLKLKNSSVSFWGKSLSWLYLNRFDL
jgi:hypothetical protein